MKQKAFCIKDVKTGIHGLPFFSPTLESGKRLFAELVSDGQSLPARYPEDFFLMEIGEFDDGTGMLTAAVPMSLGYGRAYVRKGEEE